MLSLVTDRGIEFGQARTTEARSGPPSTSAFRNVTCVRQDAAYALGRAAEERGPVRERERAAAQPHVEGRPRQRRHEAPIPREAVQLLRAPHAEHAAQPAPLRYTVHMYM